MTTLFGAARRTSRLVNRRDELNVIRGAINRPQGDDSLQVVLIIGPGGFGKTRLLEEVVGWADAPAEAGVTTQSLFSRLIELADFRLHTRGEFLHAIREALPRDDVDEFRRYDSAYSAYRLQQSSESSQARAAEVEAERAFREDYRALAERRRIVLVIDTGERLALSSYEWFQERGLLSAADLTFSTLTWLIQQIEEGTLPNTTLLLAGRGEEGRWVFESLSNAVRHAQETSESRRTPTEIVMRELRAFNDKEIKEFFTLLADEWEARTERLMDNLRQRKIAETLRRLAENDDRISVLQLYTGGQPVRLALYTDLIVSGAPIPEPLKQSYAEAIASLGGNPQLIEPETLQQAQQLIERGFINLLFAGPNRQASILKALVRAERELSESQLHFVLDSLPGTRPEDWKEDQTLLDALRRDLDELASLSIVKTMRPSVGYPNASTGDRLLTLQDELYRIYANIVAKQETSLTDERAARELLYRQLRGLAKHGLLQKRSEREAFQNEDERRLSIDSPANALRTKFPEQSDRERQQRTDVRNQIIALEIEEMYYALLEQPLENFNDVYCALADRYWLADDEEPILTAQAEAWRIVNGHQALRFAHMGLPRHPTNSEAQEALRRAALQENVIRWIKIFLIRRRFDRAIELANAVEQLTESMTGEEARAWRHTFSRAERICLREYARILKGAELDDALKTATAHVNDLVELIESNTTEIVFTERDEKGFLGHPAWRRMRRSIATVYNIIGYGYATKGLFSRAVDTYGKALSYLRDPDFRSSEVNDHTNRGTDFPALEGAVRNNLARALSEQGRIERGRRICVDGLELRRREGAIAPIALSINTLALIDNDSQRPDLAWIEAATAVAYSRRTGNDRGLGLALIQLGEALRRLANPSRSGISLSDPPERIYDQAEFALREALTIFESSSAAGEVPRRVEAWNELGCLFRDRLRRDGPTQDRRRYYREAERNLRSAYDKARELQLDRLAIDAAVNIAWTHYYFGDLDRTEDQLRTVEKLLPDDCLLREDQQPPSPLRDDSYVFFYLSKMYTLHGRVAFKRYLRAEEAEVRQSHLRQMAASFVRSLGYAQLFSPRSSALALAYDHLYECLKSLSGRDLERFNVSQASAGASFRVKQIIPQDFSDLSSFLHDNFGLSSDESAAHVGA